MDGFDVNVGFVTMPGDCSYYVGGYESEDTIEEEEQKNNYDDDDDEFKEEDPISRLAKYSYTCEMWKLLTN